jgi:hypothetical protein
VCDISTGACVLDTVANCSGTPGLLGGQPGTCTVNPGDMCCTGETCIASSGADACCPGTSGDTYCAALLGTANASCDATLFTCTACQAVSNNTYIVDPNNGSDGTGTGSAKSSTGGAEEGCALKTIARALQIIGSSPAIATTIQIVGGGALGPSAASGETFPIVLPANVSITTQANSGAVTVTVPTNATGGFVLDSPNSGISGSTGSALTITSDAPDGGTAPSGIIVRGNAGNGGTTSVGALTVTNMKYGVQLAAGTLTVNTGIALNSNLDDGLHVDGGNAVIDVTTGSATFDGNGAHGIIVLNDGSVLLTGSVATTNPPAGTIETNGNGAAGVWIEQSVGGVAAPPKNGIDGLVSTGNLPGNGMRIVAGSAVTVTNSVFLGNSGNGIIISGGGATGTNNDTTHIDLGDGTTAGNNTLQAAAGNGANGGSGLCIDLDNGAAEVSAVGNQFSEINCAVATGAILLNPKGCASGVAACAHGACDVGIENAAHPGNGSNNTVDVSQCTVP